MTDSIKHFTGFDISGKVKQNYLMLQEEWELMDATMGKGKLIDEIFWR
jgi:lysyl-tRNA synthetase class 2